MKISIIEPIFEIYYAYKKKNMYVFMYNSGLQFVHNLSTCVRKKCFYQYQAKLYYTQVFDGFNLQKIKNKIRTNRDSDFEV